MGGWKSNRMDHLFHLVMIVKNAEDTIEKTLRHAKPLISRYTILDTGSTDNTIPLIRKTMEGLQGDVFQEPFVNFEVSRNRAFDLASPSPCKYFIVLDDTYIVENPEAFKKEVLARPLAQAYAVLIKTGDQLYKNIRITRTDSGLRYKYKVHEVINVDESKTQSLPESCMLIDNVNTRHMTRTHMRQESDYKNLLSDLERFPNDPYVLFNLGRNRLNMKKTDEAIEFFKKRLFIKNYDTTYFECSNLLASLYQKKNESPDRIINMLNLSIEANPEKAETYYQLASIYYTGRDFKNAYKYIKKAYNLIDSGRDVEGILHIRNVEIPHMYIECLIQLEKFDIAQKVLVDCLTKHPSEVRFQNTAYAVTPRNPNQTIHKMDASLCVIHTGNDMIWNPEDPEKNGKLSDVMMVKMAEGLVAKGWKVIVFGPFVNSDFNYETKSRGVEYIDHTKYTDMCMKYHIDALVVSSNTSNLVFYDNIDRVYLWVNTLTPSSRGGIQVHKTKFKGMIVQSEYQRKSIQKDFPVPDDIFVLSRYAINTKNYSSVQEKVPGRFIYSATPDHGLSRAIRIVERVREWMPEAHLMVYCDRDYMDKDTLEEVDRCSSFVKVEPAPSATRLTLETLRSEWCVLPTQIDESYYMCILEAMAAGCSIVASSAGALPEMLKSRGTVVPVESDEDAYVKAIQYLSRNPTINKYLTTNAREFGISQSYQSLVNEWISMFSK
jgi:tetratricopeptide (TPR) repeat protein